LRIKTKNQLSDYRKYERSSLENLQKNERKSILSLFEAELTRRLEPFTNWDEYWKETHEIINELRRIGHDLWSHDYDGEGTHLWGWDYMRMETAGFLQIQFDFNGKVKMFWRENG
jgi:hypothetical protein